MKKSGPNLMADPSLPSCMTGTLFDRSSMHCKTSLAVQNVCHSNKKHVNIWSPNQRSFSVLEASVLDLWKPGKNHCVTVTVAFSRFLGVFCCRKQ